MQRPVVSLVRCRNYDGKLVQDAVARALEDVPGANDLLRSGARVLLKPNLISSSDPPERAVNTHPEFVRAVAGYCARRGCSVLIGDSCGSMTPGSTRRALEVTGLDRVAADTGAEMVNFDLAPAVTVAIPSGRVLRRIRLCRVVQEVDVIITLPKFKTHGLTLLTGAVKNQFGCVPGRAKKDTHLAAPKPATMAQALVDIFSVARPHLAVMDAITGMEGNGPVAGRPREIGLVLASRDCVALDAVMAALTGLAPGVVMTTRLAHERGLGVGDIAAIDTAGVPLAEATLTGFVLPPYRVQGLLFALAPARFLSWLADQAVSERPVVSDELCVGCGQCVTNCPAGAMRLSEGKAVCNHNACIGCYCCLEVCERRAIEMRRRPLGRFVRFVRRTLSSARRGPPAAGPT